MSDKIPTLNNNQSCIINNKSSSEDGEHWISLFKRGNKIIYYDSFGRDLDDIFNKDFKAPWISSDKHAEQSTPALNCGQHCLAWLVMMYKYGRLASFYI